MFSDIVIIYFPKECNMKKTAYIKNEHKDTTHIYQTLWRRNEDTRIETTFNLQSYWKLCFLT